MTTSLSILPVTYDLPYIIKKAGVVNHFGYETLSDGINFKYQVSDYEAVQAVLATYPVDYLAVARPIVLNALVAKRYERFMAFTFGGAPIPLDQNTQTNLVGVAVGLQRNTTIDHFDWHIGDGVFVTFSRDILFAIADLSFIYVQQCFTHQRELSNQAIAAADIFELANININAGWPTSS